MNDFPVLPVNVVAPVGVAEVSINTGEVSVTTERVESPVSDAQPTPLTGTPAIVTVSAGNTINTGNFTSFRIDVSLAMPSGVNAISETYDFALGWVDEKLEDITKKIKAVHGIK